MQIYDILSASCLKEEFFLLRDILLAVMEWLGTIAFSVSGALVAITCGLDLFGILIVGCLTAVGGGIIRDALIGNVPPLIFSNPEIIAVALLTSLIVFLIAYINIKKLQGLQERLEIFSVFFDAVGLAAFSITGVEITCGAGYEKNALLAITLGVITGVGGGVLRDILVNKKPYILVKHIYALASVFGSTLYFVIAITFNQKLIGTIVSLIFTVTIRMLAAKFRWKLPKISFKNIRN